MTALLTRYQKVFDEEKKVKRALLAMVLCVLVCPPASADFDLGMAAYRAQDFDLAFKVFYQDALEGHGTAQFNVGVLYYRGEGVEQDLVKAFGWIELSTQKGDQQNIQAQEVLILNMTANQILDGHIVAAELAREHGLKYLPPGPGELDSRIVVVDIR